MEGLEGGLFRIELWPLSIPERICIVHIVVTKESVENKLIKFHELEFIIKSNKRMQRKSKMACDI